MYVRKTFNFELIIIIINKFCQADSVPSLQF